MPTFTALVSLVIALAAIGVAIAAWLRPMPEHNAPPPSAPTYTEQEIADAKADVCGAYSVAKHAVVVSTHKPNPAEGDESGLLAAAANGRLAVYAAAYYLLNRLAAEPATPEHLAHAVRSLTNSFMEFGIRALGDEASADLDPLRDEMDADSATIDRLCQ